MCHCLGARAFVCVCVCESGWMWSCHCVRVWLCDLTNLVGKKMWKERCGGERGFTNKHPLLPKPPSHSDTHTYTHHTATNTLLLFLPSFPLTESSLQARLAAPSLSLSLSSSPLPPHLHLCTPSLSFSFAHSLLPCSLRSSQLGNQRERKHK